MSDATKLMRFTLSDVPLAVGALRQELQHPSCGGYVAFEGWVRNHNEGRAVLRLEYEAFAPLALREGERILTEACARYGVERACCAHRVGPLAIGDLAVWVGVSARHRGEAFDACRYIIDEVKHRVPIWKKEYYEDGDSGWVNCEHCAAAPVRSASVQTAGADDPHRRAQHAHHHQHEHEHG